MGVIAPDNNGNHNNHGGERGHVIAKDKKTKAKKNSTSSSFPGLLIFIGFVVMIFFFVIKTVTSSGTKSESTVKETSAFTESVETVDTNTAENISDNIASEIFNEVSSSAYSASYSRNYTKDKKGLYEFTSCVIDDAGLLTNSEYSKLTDFLVELNKKTGVQIAVLTVKSLDGEDIESFSLAHAEKWKLGQRGVDNGALLVVGFEEHALRIETGYGTEGVLTDAKCARIIRNVIAPGFQSGKYGEGIIAGVTNMAGIITSDESLVSSSVAEDEESSGSGVPVPVIIFMIIFFIFYFRLVIYGVTHKRTSRGPVIYHNHNNHSGGGFGGFSGGSHGGFGGGGGGFGGGGASGHW